MKLLAEGGARLKQQLVQAAAGTLGTVNPTHIAQVFVKNVGVFVATQSADTPDNNNSFASSIPGWIWLLNRDKWNEKVEIFDAQQYDTEGGEIADAVVDANLNILFGVYNNKTTTVHRDIYGMFNTSTVQTPVWGGSRLRNWQSWINAKSGKFDIVIIGDSYTQGNYYTKKFKDKLLSAAYMFGDGMTDGGSGWCGFGRWGSADISINQSIDNTKFNCAYTIAEWSTATSPISPDAGSITSLVANAVITLNVVEVSQTVKVLYYIKPAGGSFRWRLDGGAWTTVDATNATESVGVLSIATAGASVIELEALAIGVEFFGAISRNSVATGLIVHKCGKSGGNSGNFATNDLFIPAISELTPKMLVIFFGTNDQSGSMSLDTFKTNVENIITKTKSHYPLCDLVLMLPPRTNNEATALIKLDKYGGVLLKLAEKHYATYIAFPEIFGNYSADQVTYGFIHADTIHPGTKGSELIAQQLYKALI